MYKNYIIIYICIFFINKETYFTTKIEIILYIVGNERRMKLSKFRNLTIKNENILKYWNK